MLETKLKELVKNSPSFQRARDCLTKERFVRIKGLAGSLKSLLLLSFFESGLSQVIYVCCDLDEAEKIKEDLELFLPQEQVGIFASGKSRQGRIMAVNHADLSARLAALESLSEGRSLILIVEARELLSSLPAPDEFKSQKLSLVVGAELDFTETVERLFELNFTREPVVENPGEMSVRGGILDVYPHSAERPVRVEFWGDSVESLREFDPATQRSTSTIEKIDIYNQVSNGVAEAESGQASGWSIFDYFKNEALLVFDEPDLIRKELAQGAWDGSEVREVDSVDLPDDLRCSNLEKRVERFQHVHLLSFGKVSSNLIDFRASSQPGFKGNLKLFQDFVEKLNREKLAGQEAVPNILFLCESRSQALRMTDIFEEEEVKAANLQAVALSLHQGFLFPEANLVLFTDHQFYGRPKKLKLRRRFKGLSPQQLKTLSIDDFVVHEDFGIGLFKGLRRIKVRGNERECIYLEYRDGDKVYVPIERMDRVQLFSSKEGLNPRLNKLGTPDWQRLKRTTKKKIKDIAKDLIKIYAQRKAQPGFAFSEDTLWQRELEASFPYEDTPDQVKATLEVKQDMESSRPMDRLVCGDVGFGKTEVAIRAAFKAILSGKQVAMLVPTTILAYQHYSTFQDRLRNFPVTVQMLSRFRTQSEQKEIVDKLKTGQIDLVIGTHRMLSQDVEFKNLGLLIIDEEQRFGVRHKEKLKRFRATIDVLTLTATPIPRTLHLALMGTRDITNIYTPPKNRLPIITEILPFDKNAIRESILRELNRGGQVFYVHNRVQSIERVAGMLRKLVPEARVTIAHGQMHERDLERVMIEFIGQQFDVLVSTVIIESGLDMPNVNTMIINRADKMGLAQLYQLRGRVGRSSQRAYAYFLIPPLESLNENALKRLRAIEELTALGSGSQLAMRDLEIRGAGNLLGVEQSGFINNLGFELYNKILDQAVKELKQEHETQEEIPLEIETQVDIDGDAYLPDDYVSVDTQRIDVYRRLIETDSEEALDEMKSELEDRFGRLPESVQNLFYLVSFRILGRQLGLRKIAVSRKESVFEVASELIEKRGEPFNNWLGSIVANASQPFEFFQDDGFGIRVRLDGQASNYLEVNRNFLKSLLIDQNQKDIVKEDLKGALK
ncbi:MAG: transcription-repair coupling factor [bacterium]